MPQGIEKDALGGATGHPVHMPIFLSANPVIGPQGFPDMLRSRTAVERGYFRRKCRIRRSTERYMAGVTRPVWVFCWLGW